MKLTKSQLKQIIKEELVKVLKEGSLVEAAPPPQGSYLDAGSAAAEQFVKLASIPVVGPIALSVASAANEELKSNPGAGLVLGDLIEQHMDKAVIPAGKEEDVMTTAIHLATLMMDH